jgi:hypothetical protein
LNQIFATLPEKEGENTAILPFAESVRRRDGFRLIRRKRT